jgi:hypothetical protein
MLKNRRKFLDKSLSINLYNFPGRRLSVVARRLQAEVVKQEKICVRESNFRGKVESWS